MKIKRLVLYLIFFAPLYLGAQNFQINNQFGFGTTDWDFVYSVLETSDGGFLFCARTEQDISGDKTIPNIGGNLDAWLVKTNSNGTILWQKSYGGSANDALFKLLQTMDGNILISGFSNSSISGNKTSPGYGGGDFWLIKINDAGDIIWQKTYGGNGLDQIQDVVEQTNGDLICTGSTGSWASTGTRVSPLKGLTSFWVLHLDSEGNSKKEFCFGGNKVSIGFSSYRISTNSFVIIGSSNSADTLDKSEPSFGELDLWVVKSDTNGIVINDKTIGGSKTDGVRGSMQDGQGNIIIFGESESSPSGNKTAPKIGGIDLWLVKIDTNLDIIWDKTYGGILDESLSFGRAIYSSQHNLTLICLSSKSPQLGDKTSENFGGFDYWVIGLDNQGNKVMEISLGGIEEDMGANIIETSTGELLVTGASASGVSGNKTTTNKGVYHDIWAIKLDITLSINEIKNEKIDAYPIPASSILNFSVPVIENNVLAQMVDITGKIVLSKNVNNQNKGQFNVTALKPGTYFLRLTGESFSYSRMVVIE